MRNASYAAGINKKSNRVPKLHARHGGRRHSALSREDCPYLDASEIGCIVNLLYIGRMP